MRKKIVLLTVTAAIGSIALFGCNSEKEDSSKPAVTSDAVSSDATSAASSDAIKYDENITKENIEAMTPLFSGLQSYMYTKNANYSEKDDAFYYNTLVWSVNACANSGKLDASASPDNPGTISSEELNAISSSLFSEKGEIDPKKIPQNLDSKLSYNESKKNYSVRGKDLTLLPVKVVSVNPIEGKKNQYDVQVDSLNKDEKSAVANFKYVLESNNGKYLSIKSVTMNKVSDINKSDDTSSDSKDSTVTTNKSTSDVNKTKTNSKSKEKALEDIKESVDSSGEVTVDDIKKNSKSTSNKAKNALNDIKNSKKN